MQGVGDSFEEINKKLNTSSAIKLLRARRAPLIISFLLQEFKTKNRMVVTQTEMRYGLSSYLQHVQDEEEIDFLKDYQEQARLLLDEWCHDSNRYLKRYPDEKGQPLLELSPDTEKVLRWVEELQEREFVGTDSRFRDIFTKLKDIVENSTGDPKQKIDELETRKEEIEAQIREIKRTGQVETYTPVQLQERFMELSRQARALLSDFSEVEQNFQGIVRTIYQQQSEAKAQKGTILSYTLEATDELRQSPQGQSFYNFYEFLLRDTEREYLRELVEDVYKILEQKGIQFNDTFLLHLKSYLLRSSQKVVATNHLLSDRLNRLLSERNLLDRRKSISIIKEIKGLIYNLKEIQPTIQELVYIETEAALHFPLERPLGERPITTTFHRQATGDGNEVLEEDSLSALFNQVQVDKDKLSHQIEKSLQERTQISLGQLLQTFPVQQGLAEVVTYFSIGASISRYFVVDGETETIWLEEGLKEITVPKLLFTR